MAIDVLDHSRIETVTLVSAAAVRTRRIRRLRIIALLSAVVALLLWVEREPLFRGAAEAWIVSDPVTQADAAVVLGGGIDVRPFAAAELYRKGLVKKVLVSDVEDDRAAALGVVSGHTEANRRVLLSLGVPAAAIENFGSANKNTRDEALALRAWTDQHPTTTLIVPTEIFVARRVRWMFRHEFAGRDVRIIVPSFEPPQYTAARWWEKEAGIVAFQNEILKYLYYRLNYWRAAD
jgi:uncharacterized SAM-binding protein YcdF (DUF218 family)